MADFKTLFEEYGGDYEATIERFMGNEKLYLKLLDMLFEDDNFSKLESAVLAGELNAAFEAAHTLKGVCGNMGLTPLYQSVCDILEPLRRREQNRDYPAMCKTIELEFQRARTLKNKLKGECRL